MSASNKRHVADVIDAVHVGIQTMAKHRGIVAGELAAQDVCLGIASVLREFLNSAPDRSTKIRMRHDIDEILDEAARSSIIIPHGAMQ